MNESHGLKGRGFCDLTRFFYVFCKLTLIFVMVASRGLDFVDHGHQLLQFDCIHFVKIA